MSYNRNNNEDAYYSSSRHGQKRNFESSTSFPEPNKRFKEEEGLGSLVAKHYNELEERGIRARAESQIYHMRNFNNWIKTMLINDAIQRVRSERQNKELTILDMCCGKGGDMIKWLKSNAAKHIVFADIAEVSVNQCQERYMKVVGEKQLHQYDRRGEKTFTAEFITADCSKERLRDKYTDPSIQFDLVSVQFSFHYSFESLEQAKTMMQNISENLRIGAYFIGTIPNANRIVRQIRASGGKSFGNPIFRIDFDCDEPYPLFGAKYFFKLEEVVNCPEFLVHFGTLERLARRYGLSLVFQKTFDEFYHHKQNEGQFLLERMSALETYPAGNGSSLAFHDTETEYAHAQKLFQEGQSGGLSFGTLAKSEWEAVTLYTAFMFQKI